MAADRRDPLQPGDSFGDYRVVKLLGRGGMGAVYLVTLPSSGASYALKVMAPPDDDARHEWRMRFAREADFAMAIRHKNLISVYDVGEDPDTGLCYIIMDYVPGGTLSSRLARAGKLGVHEAVGIAVQVANVLDVAHKAGVVHRDVKPDNIMFNEDGVPKLADLGIAKFTREKESDSTVTKTGVIIGTPAYMSPEQLMDSHNVDARADIYSLGVVLYEMLTGARPHADSSMVELLSKAIQGEELPNVLTVRPDVPDAVAYALSKMVSLNVEARPQTAADAAKLLTDAITGRLAVRRRKTSSRLRVAKTSLRRAVPWALGVLGMASAFAIARTTAPRPVAAPPPPPRVQVVTNTVELVHVVTNKIEVVKTVSAPKREEAAIAPRPDKTTDSTVRTAVAGGYTWHYTLQDGKAILWRGANTPHGMPCLEPAPKGRVVVPEKVDGYPVGEIGALAFFECGEMTEIVLPPTVTRLGDRCFMGCSQLTEIVFPDSVESLGIWAFNRCHSLKRAHLARCGRFERGNGAFALCRALEKFTLSPDNPALVLKGDILFSRDGRQLFACPPRVRLTGIPDGVEEIAAFALWGNDVARLELPRSVSRLGEGAFMDCARLRELVFEGDAPSVVRGYGIVPLLRNTSGELLVRVRQDSKGWAAPDSGEIPERWPQDDGRRIVADRPRPQT